MMDPSTRSSLELLYNVSRELATALDLRTVLQRVLFLSLKNVGGERGSVIVLDDSGKPVDSTIVYGAKVHDHTTLQLRETMERGLAGWVVRNRKPAWVPDTSKDERWVRRPDDAAERSGAKSALCVPLMARENLVGVLTLVHPVPGTYSTDHFDLMQAIADQAGIAVLNARLYAESQRQARVMTALAASAATINASLHLDEVLQRILQETIQALQVETVALALVESGGSLIFRDATGEHAASFIGKQIPAGQGVAGWVAKGEAGVIIPTAEDDERYLVEAQQVRGVKVRALACAPIHAQGRVIGVLEAVNPTSGTFDPDALLVLSGIGNLAGSTIQHAQLFERLQAAHKRYRELFDDSIDPILLTDWDGNILEVNRQAAELSGFGAEELRKVNLASLFERSEKEAAADALQQGMTCQFESLLKRKEGQACPIQVSVRRVVFEDIDSLQWMLRDISERKELDSLRDDMMAMIYHDLRSPLANVVSSLEVLATLISDDDNGSIRAVLTIASRSTDRIQRLVSSLLDINRLESGTVLITRKPTNTRMLVEEAVEAVLPMVESRRQMLAQAMPDKMPEIQVDTDMIRRVLINLLENASKYTPSGGELEVGARMRNKYIEMWVKDNGPGIPAADQERIFEKFTRLDGERSVMGLGVGLAFCRLAVNAHGGSIHVESTPGKGSRFIFTLPLETS